VIWLIDIVIHKQCDFNKTLYCVLQIALEKILNDVLIANMIALLLRIIMKFELHVKYKKR